GRAAPGKESERMPHTPPTAAAVANLFRSLGPAEKEEFLRLVGDDLPDLWLRLDQAATILGESLCPISKHATKKKLSDNGRRHKGRRVRADSVTRKALEMADRGELRRYNFGHEYLLEKGSIRRMASADWHLLHNLERELLRPKRQPKDWGDWGRALRKI